MAITPAKPKKSPSLNQNGPAMLLDENSNHIPCVAVIEPNSSGASGMTAAVLTEGQTSQVTGLQDPPSLPSGVPAIALVSCNPATGALSVYKPKNAVLADTATLAVAATTLNGKFASAEQTGTGSAQSIAHGLGTVPGAVLISITDPGLETAGAADGAKRAVIAEGTHTTTNVVVTVTSGAKYKILALK